MAAQAAPAAMATATARPRARARPRSVAPLTTSYMGRLVSDLASLFFRAQLPYRELTRRI